MKKIYFSGIFFLFILIIFCQEAFSAATPYFYQIKVYHIKTSSQEQVLDSFLKRAYLPALHRIGIPKIGVFKLREPDTSGQLVYVLIPVKKMDEILKIDSKLANDPVYQTEGKDYLQAAYNHAPYNRIESILLKAFQSFPEPKVPQLSSLKADRVYELRSYESPTENLHLNKVGMFNDKEVTMFTQLNFNEVFYAQVIFGSHMPNLMYMTTFNNKTERDQKWVAFGDIYKTIRDLPKYRNNISKANIYFLYPTQYSDF